MTWHHITAMIRHHKLFVFDGKKQQKFLKMEKMDNTDKAVKHKHTTNYVIVS